MAFISKTLGFSVGLLAASIPAFAGFTPITPPVGEETHAEIFSYIYKSTFRAAGSSGLDYTDGKTYAQRVQDYSVLSPTNATNIVGSSTTTDEFWTGNFTNASAEAKYAVYSQNFGYFDSTNTYKQIFNQTGWGYNVHGDASLSGLNGMVIRWGRGGENRIVSSNPTDNSDGRDHMVTYEITSNNVATAAVSNTRTWLLFFEDSLTGERVADADFNDLVVQIQATVVPEPATLSLISLGGIFGLSRRRRV